MGAFSRTDMECGHAASAWPSVMMMMRSGWVGRCDHCRLIQHVRESVCVCVCVCVCMCVCVCACKHTHIYIYTTFTDLSQEVGESHIINPFLI